MSVVRTIIAAVTTMIVWPIAASADQPQVTLRLLHFLPAASPVHSKILLPWAERLMKESDGRLRVDVYPAMQLGGRPAELYDMADKGVVDMVWTLPSYTPGRFPRIEVFELPFMMTTRLATSRAAWAYYQAYAANEFAGVVPLSVHVIGSGAFHMRSRPVRGLDDLAGMRIRAPARMSAAMLKAFGAEPVEVPAPAVNAALREDKIDGAIANWDFAVSSRMIDLTKFDCELDAGGGPALQTSVILIAMNRNRYDTLPADLRAVLDRNSGDALVTWLSGVWGDEELEGRAAARAIGNETSVIPAAEVEKMRAAASSVPEQWIVQMDKAGHDGKALYQGAKNLIARFGK